MTPDTPPGRSQLEGTMRAMTDPFRPPAADSRPAPGKRASRRRSTPAAPPEHADPGEPQTGADDSPVTTED